MIDNEKNTGEELTSSPEEITGSPADASVPADEALGAHAPAPGSPAPAAPAADAKEEATAEYPLEADLINDIVSELEEEDRLKNSADPEEDNEPDTENAEEQETEETPATPAKADGKASDHDSQSWFSPEQEKPEEKKKRRKLKVLPVILILTCLLTAAGSIYLKYTVCREKGLLQDTFAVAIPFILIQDDTMREQVFGPADADEAVVTVEQTVAESSETEGTAEETASTETAQSADNGLGPVTDDYWNGVLFIGDSRTEGMYLYAPCPGATYFATSSVGPFGILDETFKLTTRDYKDKSLVDLLKEGQYHTVYIMLGINDLGHSMDGLRNAHIKIMDTVLQYQPDAKIVLMASLRVTKSVSDKNADLNIDRFFEFEDVLKGLADNQTVFYLDVNPLFCDEDGYFKDEYTKDGSHPFAVNYETWRDFLYQNGVQNN